MNAAIVSRTLSLIPDRTPRALTGSTFTEEQALRTDKPERIAHLMRYLGWLGPLNPLTKDDLRILGLLNPYGKPVTATGELVEAGEDEETLESEDDLEEISSVFSEATQPPAPPAAP